MATRKDRKLRLLIADDHELVLDMLRHFLSSVGGMDVETVQSLGAALERIAEDGRFDLVLLDYNMPGMNGFVGLRDAIEANGGNVVLFSGSAAWPLIEGALENGARGFIPKTMPARSLLNALRFIASGEVFVPTEWVGAQQSRAAVAHDLKPIEMQVLMHLCEGRQNKEIASALGFTEMTVKMHVKSICGKLGASNRTQAVLVAKRENIF